MTSSSVTQTWQVGPNFLKKSVEELSEIEVTNCFDPEILHLSVSSHLFDSPQYFDLNAGLHSFVVDESGRGRFISGDGGNAVFDINVAVGGAFLITRQKGLVKLNHRKCLWARLRKGDEILALGHRIEWTQTKDDEGDQTIVASRARNESGKSGNSRNRALTLRHFKSGLLVLCVVLVTGIFFLSPSSQKKMSEPYAPALDMSTALVQGIDSEGVLDGKQFEELIILYRAGEKNTACGKMAKLVSEQKIDNIWFEKVRLFLQRRCE